MSTEIKRLSQQPGPNESRLQSKSFALSLYECSNKIPLKSNGITKKQQTRILIIGQFRYVQSHTYLLAAVI